jgi:hypothetical protein
LKKLTIKLRHKDIPPIRPEGLESLRQHLYNSPPVPKFFVEFLDEYQGAKVAEYLFTDKKSTGWIMGFIMKIQEALALTAEFTAANNKNSFVPFASNAGGWHFCICLGENDYGAIYVNRWTDHTPENAFVKIADALEEFVDGLTTEEQ